MKRQKTTPISTCILSIILLSLSLFLLAPTATSQTSLPQLGFHIDQGDVTHMEAAKAAGASFVVIVFGWDTIEPEPNYLYWEVPDAALRTAEFYGLEVVARLDRPPEWAIDDTSPTPWHLEAYETFVQRVAARYSDRLAGLIIWNEPNLSLEWNEQPPDPVGYVELLRRAYQAVKSTTPELPVLLAGLAFTQTDDGTAMNDLDFMQTVYEAGGGQYFDILAAHPYGFGRPPTEAPNSEQLNFRRLELHRDLMLANGDGDKPVWITEMGWRTNAPNPADAWQIVTPAQQTDYMFQAIDYTADNYPWLDRLAFWELKASGDNYGYDFWHGPTDISPAYHALVKNCTTYNPLCTTDPATKRQSPNLQSPVSSSQSPISSLQSPDLQSPISNLQFPIPILAPDTIIRLGDRGTLHPHWVHLHRGGENFSPDWQADFFLTIDQAERDYDLFLETMQIDQPTNRLQINGNELPQLRTRSRPDPTSTWVTQRFAVSSDLLQPGPNTIELISGLRNPARQYSFWRWENFQFRNMRLVEPNEAQTEPILTGWQQRATPGGWGETNRLRPGLNGEVWLTINRAGSLWQGQTSTATDQTTFQNQAGNRPDLLFTDVLPTPQGELATTQHGLVWREKNREAWTIIEETPEQYGYVVVEVDAQLYAGFEESGLWSASQPTGPWQQIALDDLTVLDIAAQAGQLYVATNDGIYVRLAEQADWQRLPSLPGDSTGESGNPLKRFMSRLWLGSDGSLIVRNLDQLWRYPAKQLQTGAEATWQPFGPTELHESNELYTLLDCCQPGALVGSNYLGVWQLLAEDQWQRVDGSTFDTTDIADFVRVGENIYGAGLITLLTSPDEGRTWQDVEGLPSVVSDLLIDPADPTRWVAGTPTGVYLSRDSGQSWAWISPPWTVWDMAFGPQGRLFVARNQGISWTDDLSRTEVVWEKTRGLGQALFFNVDPHPTQEDVVLAGSWGNDLGFSEDGGQSIRSIHNGLETLSVLDVLWHPQGGQLTIGTIEGLFRTDDGGASWFKLPGPLTNQTIYSLTQTKDTAIWAGAADGLWASQDYGVTWQRPESMPVATVLRTGQIAVAEQSWLWAGTEERGLWLSSDNGASWQLAGLEGLSVYNLLVDPNRAGYLIAATGDGIYEIRASF